MMDFIREFIIRYKKVIIAALLVLSVSLVFICNKEKVKAGNEHEVSRSDKRFTEYRVVQGDSLWKIAEANIDYDYYDNIYDYMSELKRMNNLDSEKIYVGQSLIITYYVND